FHIIDGRFLRYGRCIACLLQPLRSSVLIKHFFYSRINRCWILFVHVILFFYIPHIGTMKLSPESLFRFFTLCHVLYPHYKLTLCYVLVFLTTVLYYRSHERIHQLLYPIFCIETT